MNYTSVLLIEAVSIITLADIDKRKNMTEQTEDAVFVCGGCSERIGELVSWRGKVYLVIGKQHIYSYHGYCDCGRQVHFDASEMILKRLMKRREKMKGIIADL
jgi:hypothetical protein